MHPTSPEATLIRVFSAQELEWRTRRMTQLGAGEDLAATVAASDVDLHDLERMLKGGCTLDLAWEITQPLAAAPPAGDAKDE